MVATVLAMDITKHKQPWQRPSYAKLFIFHCRREITLLRFALLQDCPVGETSTYLQGMFALIYRNISNPLHLNCWIPPWSDKVYSPIALKVPVRVIIQLFLKLSRVKWVNRSHGSNANIKYCNIRMLQNLANVQSWWAIHETYCLK